MIPRDNCSRIPWPLQCGIFFSGEELIVRVNVWTGQWLFDSLIIVNAQGKFGGWVGLQWDEVSCNYSLYLFDHVELQKVVGDWESEVV